MKRVKKFIIQLFSSQNLSVEHNFFKRPRIWKKEFLHAYNFLPPKVGNTWQEKWHYMTCDQSSVRYIFFVIATATATFPKNVIATVIATFLKKVIATATANFFS